MNPIKLQTLNQAIEVYDFSNKSDLMFNLLKINVLDKAAEKANSTTFAGDKLITPLAKWMRGSNPSLTQDLQDFEVRFRSYIDKDSVQTKESWENHFSHVLSRVFFNEKGPDYTALNERVFVADTEGVIHVVPTQEENQQVVEMQQPISVETNTQSCASKSFSQTLANSNTLFKRAKEENRLGADLKEEIKSLRKHDEQTIKQQTQRRQWLMHLVMQAKKLEDLVRLQ